MALGNRRAVPADMSKVDETYVRWLNAAGVRVEYHNTQATYDDKGVLPRPFAEDWAALVCQMCVPGDSRTLMPADHRRLLLWYLGARPEEARALMAASRLLVSATALHPTIVALLADARTARNRARGAQQAPRTPLWES
jgi:hypothetical protein